MTRRRLAGIVLLLAGLQAPRLLAAAELDAPPPPPDRIEFAAPQDAPAGTAGTAGPRGNPLWSIPLASLSATRERPIFSPSRRPAEPADAAPAAADPAPVAADDASGPEPLGLTLVGTVVGSSDGYGIFIDPATSAVVRLKTGEAHQGWVLQTVDVRQAQLQNGDATTVLSLPDHSADAVATAVVAPAGQAQPAAEPEPAE